MKLKAADLFCGAGGTSKGAKDAGANVVFALNHWPVAIKTHEANFRDTRHVNSRLDMCPPSECPPINLLFASPECTHHSNARGGQPMDDQRRAGAWDVAKWVEFHRPSYVVVENVREFRQWGPLNSSGRPLKSQLGKTFDAWLMAMQSYGYKVEHHLLNAADFGAPTSRTRLIVIARKGNRAPIFPDPTHARNSRGALPGMGLQKWGSAASIIDWSIRCPSIFNRKRPLKAKTLRRIELGLKKFVGPFQYQLIGRGAGRSQSVDDTVPTIIAVRENHGLVVPYQVRFRNNMDAADIYDPVGTITAGGCHHGVAVPYLADTNHGDDSKTGSRTYSLSDPLGAVTTKRGKALLLPFLSSYYGNAQFSGSESPVPTITTKDRHCMICPELGTDVPDWRAIQQWESEGGSTAEPMCSAMLSLLMTMERLGVVDIGFRMLNNRELAAAQSFPSDYILHGTKTEITCQIGNSVPPLLAQAITETIAA